jgi:hypothetical protein
MHGKRRVAGVGAGASASASVERQSEGRIWARAVRQVKG